MTVTFIGLGLIGGSMAIALREKAFATRLIGCDLNIEHCKKALELGLVDEIMNLKEAVEQSNLVILAIPVDAAADLLPVILAIPSPCVIMDVGSVKSAICCAVADNPQRPRFVATHPMWGTEFSGPEAAVKDAFKNKAAVICDKAKSSENAINVIKAVYQVLGMHVIYMDHKAHDIHTAYISHVSHITSYALANTVLEKEKEDNTIFELASGGFDTTVRLAKSHAAMWIPIFKQNRENVLDVLNEHISQLRKLKTCLEKENFEYMTELIENANTIKRILK